MAEKSVVQIGADLSELRRDLAKLPNLASDAAQKTLIKLEKAVARTEAATKKSIKAANAAQKAFDKDRAAGLEATKQGLYGVLELGGISTEKFTKFGDVLKGVGEGGMGAVAVGATAAAVAVAAVAAGIVAAGVGAVALVANFDDIAKATEPFDKVTGFSGFPDSALNSIENANLAMQGVSIIFKQVGQVLAVELAPVVEAGMLLVLELGLRFRDLISSVLGSGEALKKFVNGAINSLFDMLTSGGLTSLILELVAGLSAINRAIGNDIAANALDKVAASLEKVQKKAVEFAEKGRTSLLEFGEYANISFQDFTSNSRAVLEGLDKTNKQLERSASAAQAAKAAQDAFNTSLDRLVKISEESASTQLSDEDKIIYKYSKKLEAVNEIVKKAKESGVVEEELLKIQMAAVDASANLKIEELAALNELAAKKEEHARLELERIERIRIAEEDAAKAKIAADKLKTQQAINNALSSADLIGSSIKQLTELSIEQGNLSDKSAKKLLIAEKARAIVTSIINTALAVTKTYSEYGGTPVGIAAATAVGIQGATSTSLIAAQPILHSGGIIQPDEISVRAQVGEAVLTKAATRALGEESIGRINRGEFGGNSNSVVIEMNHEVFQTGLRDIYRRDGSPLRNSARKSRRR